MNAQDGQAIFKKNCAVCHTTTKQKLVGPGLEGISTLRKEEWLIKWIKDSQALVNSGDAEALTVFEAGNKVVMPPFASLSDQDIKDILSFISTAVPAQPEVASSTSATPVVKKQAPWSTAVKVLVAALILLVLSLFAFITYIKYDLRKLGIAMDSVPLKDQVGKYLRSNGRFLFFIGIIAVVLVMKSCISEIMQ
ncbi:MAG: cytochrome c [Sphingobacteriaceae bacterium]|nr:cytochrome c [Sphingobacteriaceae bacterium]